jgi:hypothetical protein
VASLASHAFVAAIFRTFLATSLSQFCAITNHPDRPENSHISAVLYGSADCANFPFDPGSDFVLVHNPLRECSSVE